MRISISYLQAGHVQGGEEWRWIAEAEGVRALRQIDLVGHLEPVKGELLIPKDIFQANSLFCSTSFPLCCSTIRGGASEGRRRGGREERCQICRRRRSSNTAREMRGSFQLDIENSIEYSIEISIKFYRVSHSTAKLNRLFNRVFNIQLN